MTVRLFKDAEGSAKTWLRSLTGSQTDVPAAAPGGIWIGTPSSTPASAWLTLFLVSDVPRAGGTVPATKAMLQFDCYAPRRADAAVLAYALVTACESLDPGTQISPDHICEGIAVTRAQWIPDPTTTRVARYSVDAVFHLIAL